MALDPVERPLTAGRWVPFVHDIIIEGLDLTGATFAMQVRDDWNGGAVRADLATETVAGTEGVRFAGVETVDGVDTSTLEVVIAEATMEAMPLDAANPDGPLTLVYDLQITRTAGQPEVMMRGTFTVQEGSTE